VKVAKVSIRLARNARLFRYAPFRKARNVPGVLNGGAENVLNVDVGLFRKTYGSKNIFDTRIQSGDTVVLGEEILLRVLVNGDDSKRINAEQR